MKAFGLILISFSLSAGTLVAFQKDRIYKTQGHLEGKFFVINHETGNEQRFLISAKHNMVNGAQYEVCLKMNSDCHMSCEAQVVGKERFLTPNIQPENLIPDERGVHAPVNAADCP